MAERPGPRIYSIAAHRGFADALVSGLVPRYSDPLTGLARLTLLLPSSRAARTISEAFIRHYGENDGPRGLLMPRMVVVGDLDLDEALGPLLDPLGAGSALPPAVDPTYRWLRLAELIREYYGKDAPGGSALLRLARDAGRVMDRLLVEEIEPDDLLGDRVLDLLDELSDHWQRNLHLFATIQRRWVEELRDRAQVDASTRRNMLFRHAARRWSEVPPATPIVAAGVTSAAPALAQLLRVVSDLPLGAVVLPDLDLTMAAEVWDELGAAGTASRDTPFARADAVTHPQYHLKLLLNRMGIARGEVQQWHRAGAGKGPPERSHAISSMFLPPQASKAWVDLPSAKRRMTGVTLVESANPESEAQAIALLVRRALDEPTRRIAVITPDRGLASRVVQHLRRWNIAADDSAGQPLPQSTAGRLFLLLAEVMADHAAPVPLMALLEHPLVRRDNGRADWLDNARRFEMRLRGPRPAAGLEPLAGIAQQAGLAEWWLEVETILAPLFTKQGPTPLPDLLDLIVRAAEQFCGTHIWAREDGRALARLVEDLRLHSRAAGTIIAADDLPAILRDALDVVAVRPPYGGHPRIAIYGLLESRMTRADLVICAGLNEGVWPATPATDPILAPAVLRALGVPGADFRIGLAAHDLAGALGAPNVVLSRAVRDAGGPAIPSRFLLRVRALLGNDLIERHEDNETPELVRALDAGTKVPHHPRPMPVPNSAQRNVKLSVTGLDRLRSDPYQFYASSILGLREIDALDAQPTPAWQGTLVHAILEDWHKTKGLLGDIANRHLEDMHAHPLMRALWRPRLMNALEWIRQQIENEPEREPVAIEASGKMEVKGVTIHGKADRIDRLPGGGLAIVDYKTGGPPSGREVEAGYALQLGTLGLMAQAGAFKDARGDPQRFEYWSLGRSSKSETGFGYIATPLKVDAKRSGIPPEEFLPQTREFLLDALDTWILGDAPFTARLNPDARNYNTYDQLMRLDEWIGREE